MSSPSIMQRIGTKAKNYADMAKSLPIDDSTIAGLKASAENVSGQALANEPVKDTTTTSPSAIRPMDRYGSRPGEVRLDSEGNVESQQPAKIYDDGGDIPMPNSNAAANQSAVNGATKAIDALGKKKAPADSPDVMYESQGALNNIPQVTSSAAPAMPVMGMPTGANLPVADQGMNVDVNDGQHQVAILKTGEKVLNPAEADAYRAGQATQMKPLGMKSNIHETMNVDTGKPSSYLPPLTPDIKPTKTSYIPAYDNGGDVGAPADFGGRVMPNPHGVKPMLDTEIPPPETERISGGAKMNTDNAPLSNPKGDTSNPLQADVLTPAPPEVQAAGMKEAGVQPTQQPAPEVKGTDAERKAIEVDKQQAMGSGNLVKLGTAIINERHLKPMANEPKLYDEGGDVNVPEDKLKAPPEFNQGYKPMTDAEPAHGVGAQGEGTEPAAQKPAGVVAPPEMAHTQMKQMQAPQEAAPQPAATPAVATPAPAPVDPKTAYKAKIADYDTRHQQALDEGTLEGKTKADYIAYAKQAFINKNPWGSPDNHPGFMGKLGHGLAKAGEIAANVVAPGITAPISGSMVNRGIKQMNTQTDIDKDQPMLTAQQAEETKTTKAKQYDFKESTDANGDPVWIGINKSDPSDVVKTNNPAFVKESQGKPTDQTSFVNQWYKDNPIATKSTDNDTKAIQAYHAATAPPTTLMEPVPGNPGMLEARQVKPGEQITTGASKPGAVESQEAGVEKVFKGKTLIQTNPDGSRKPVTYEQAKANGFEGVAPLTSAQEEKERKKSDTFSAATSGIDTYQKDQTEAKLTDRDKLAMQTLIAAGNEEHSDFIKNITGDLIDAVVGEPLTGYSQKAMGGVMTKDQYDAMSPAARKVLADYYNTMFLHFANVKETQGGMPRNPRMIAFEIGNIPLPWMSPEQAQPGFDVLRERLGGQNRSNIPFNTPKPNAAGVTQGGMEPPKEELKPGMEWQHRTTNGKTEWRQAPATANQ